jgi:hypothetical protein
VYGESLAVDLVEDARNALDRVITEDTDIARQALGLDATSPYGVLYAVNGFAQFPGDSTNRQSEGAMGPHRIIAPDKCDPYSVQHTLCTALDSGLTYPGACLRLHCACKRLHRACQSQRSPVRRNDSSSCFWPVGFIS